MQLARTQSISCVGRSGRRVPMWLLVGDVAFRAVLWLSLPLYLFPHMDPATQVIAASIIFSWVSVCVRPARSAASLATSTALYVGGKTRLKRAVAASQAFGRTRIGGPW